MKKSYKNINFSSRIASPLQPQNSQETESSCFARHSPISARFDEILTILLSNFTRVLRFFYIKYTLAISPKPVVGAVMIKQYINIESVELKERLDYNMLLEKLDAIARTSNWEIAGVICTFLAVLVALFFPLREYLRILPKFAIKLGWVELRSENSDGIAYPHMSISIRNLSKEIIYIKDSYFYITLKSCEKFLVCMPLGLDKEIKILPYSEEDFDFFFLHRDASNGFKPIRRFLKTEKEIWEQYLRNVWGFEKVKDISFGIHTNLGRHIIKLPKWQWEEVKSNIYGIIRDRDKEYMDLMKKKRSKNNSEDAFSDFKEIFSNLKELEDKKYQQYNEDCRQKMLEKKERKNRFKAVIKNAKKYKD